MKTEKFNLLSGTDTQTFDAEVRVIKYDSGQSGGLMPTIRVRSLSGGAYDVELTPGRQITLPQVTRGIVIQSLTGQGVSGKLTIGAGDVTDNNVTGEVNVIDSSRSVTLLNMAFGGAYNSAAAIAAQFSYGQLHNPAGSGKRIIVREITVAPNVATGVAFAITTATLGTVGGLQGSKLGGGGAGIGRFYTGQSATDLLTGLDQVVYVASAAGISVNQRFSEPIILPPGYGLTGRASIYLAEFRGAIQTVEEAI